jgi:hypothetical protein
MRMAPAGFGSTELANKVQQKANSVEPKPASGIRIQWRPIAHTCKIFSHLKWEIWPRGESGRVYLVAAKIACFGHGRNEKMRVVVGGQKK